MGKPQSGGKMKAFRGPSDTAELARNLDHQNMKLTPGEMRTMRISWWYCRSGCILGLAVKMHTAEVLGFCRPLSELGRRSRVADLHLYTIKGGSVLSTT